MANAKNITSADTNILLIGDSGTGKTNFIGTIADAGESVYVFDFDKGMATLAGKDVEYDTFKEASKGQKVLPFAKAQGVYEFAAAWPAFIKKLNDIGALIDQGKGPQNIAFDSLTFMSMIAMSHVLFSTNQDMPHQGSWGAQQEYIKRVLNQVTAWPVRLICTAHIQRDTNDLTQVTEKLPLLTGKLAGLISAFFDEVYYTEVDTDKNGKQTFWLRTASDVAVKQAGSRLKVPNKTPSDFREVRKFFPKPASVTP